jgi:hypothetical protein
LENEEELMNILPKTNHPNHLIKVLMTDYFGSAGPDTIPALLILDDRLGN